MTFENPTPLRIGALGTLNHWPARVAGRVVLSAEEAGTRYVWQEFNLVDDAGASATLVYEETEAGPTWKVFREFTPSRPLTAESAAVLRVGSTVMLDPAPAQVTFVGESRVEHIEGEPPAGTHVGDRARFFNAESGDRMLVGCWTGADITFYEGFTAPSDRVAGAFGLVAQPRVKPRSLPALPAPAGAPTSRRAIVIAAVVLAVAGAITTVIIRTRSPRPAEVATFVAAPPARVAAGAEGRLAGQTWRIASAHELEIARVTGTYGCREYRLLGADGAAALLVHGFDADARAWHLLQPGAAPPALTPSAAARLKRNATLSLPSGPVQVVDVFQVRTLSGPRSSSSATLSPPAGAATVPKAGAITPPTAAATSTANTDGGVEYGFVAKQGADWSLARWTETELRLFRVTALREADVLAAFRGQPTPR